MFKTAIALILALCVGYALHAFAQPRADFRQGVLPMGSSSSNGVGFAWFYDPADRTVHVCRTGQGGAKRSTAKRRRRCPDQGARDCASRGYPWPRVSVRMRCATWLGWSSSSRIM